MYEAIYYKDNLPDISLDNEDNLEVITGTAVSVSGSAIDLIYAEAIKTNEYLLFIIVILLITFAWKQIVSNFNL